jgi:hypothetical protein
VKHSVHSINAKQQPEPSIHFSGAIRPNFAEIDPHPGIPYERTTKEHKWNRTTPLTSLEWRNKADRYFSTLINPLQS